MKAIVFSTSALLALAALSCKKSPEETVDEARWVNVTVSGRAYEADGNTPLAGRTVSVKWEALVFVVPGSGSTPPDNSVDPLATTTTDADGRYTMTVRVDERMNSLSHHLDVALAVDTTIHANRAGWMYIPKAVYSASTSSFPLPMATQYTIDLPVLRRTMLTIRNQQVQPGALSTFRAFYRYALPNEFPGFLGNMAFDYANGVAGSNSIVVPTVANRFTTINWDAVMQNGTRRHGTDSIFATLSGPNEYIINW
ncbi:MAG: hypothetical protein EOO15_13000 [Chitinophagaceae bacterium]|nr:MAG: hypothetical protein EOO15_13000 [Chitinophagaceae bacterium]